MTAVFHKNIDFQGGEYGNAILTSLPVLAHDNHHYRMLRPHEQRGLLRVAVEFGGREIQFLATHIDHRPDDAERISNLAEIESRLTPAPPRQPWIVCGDFNDTPGSGTHRAATQLFIDSWVAVGDGQGHTYPSGTPTKRIDYVFLRRGCGMVPRWAKTVRSAASDHLPVIVEIRMR